MEYIQVTSFDFGTVIAELNWLNLKDKLLVRIAERSHPLTPGKKWSSPHLRQRPAPECVCEAGIAPGPLLTPRSVFQVQVPRHGHRLGIYLGEGSRGRTSPGQPCLLWAGLSSRKLVGEESRSHGVGPGLLGFSPGTWYSLWRHFSSAPPTTDPSLAPKTLSRNLREWKGFDGLACWVRSLLSSRMFNGWWIMAWWGDASVTFRAHQGSSLLAFLPRILMIPEWQQMGWEGKASAAGVNGDETCVYWELDLTRLPSCSWDKATLLLL